MNDRRALWCWHCGHHLPPLRWWQRGLLRPLPICPPADAEGCQRRYDASRLGRGTR